METLVTTDWGCEPYDRTASEMGRIGVKSISARDDSKYVVNGCKHEGIGGRRKESPSGRDKVEENSWRDK